MKSKFLTVYDYGTGGIWTVIYARNKKEITKKFPELIIYDYDQPPAWMEKKELADIESEGVYDIDTPPGKFLSSLLNNKDA